MKTIYKYSTLDQSLINAKEMNEKGFQCLFSCYNHGIDQLNKI